MMLGGDDDFGKGFFSDILRHVASMTLPTAGHISDDVLYTTSRDAFHGTREDVSTESGITVSDETSLLVEARPSPVDMGKQKEIVGVIRKFLQVSTQGQRRKLSWQSCVKQKQTLSLCNDQRLITGSLYQTQYWLLPLHCSKGCHLESQRFWKQDHLELEHLHAAEWMSTWSSTAQVPS